jgi:hypothetical protein
MSFWTTVYSGPTGAGVGGWSMTETKVGRHLQSLTNPHPAASGSPAKPAAEPEAARKILNGEIAAITYSYPGGP